MIIIPFKPKHPCSHPGCPALIPPNKKYCEKHLKLHPEYTRPAAARGYGYKWRKARKKYLETHPLCVKCLENKTYEKATVVDHIIPHRGDPKLFWDESNWQSLCKRHHDKKSLTEDVNPTYRY